MKVFHKLIAFVLLLLFATESFGISRYAHFCGGEVTSETYFIQKKECCCDEAEEAEMDIDCCKDEIKVVQNVNDQVLPVENLIDAPNINFVTIFFSIYSDSFIAPLMNSTFAKDSQINLSFDTSPPKRELFCCMII